MVLTVLVFSFFWPVLHALEIGRLGLLTGSVFFQFTLFGFRGFPFSKKPEKVARSGQFVLAMMLSMFGILFLLPLLLQTSQFAVLLTLAGLLAGNIVLGQWVNRRYAKSGLAPQ